MGLLELPGQGQGQGQEEPTRRSIIIHPKQLSPIPDGVKLCATCGLLQARLVFHEFDREGKKVFRTSFLCSLCFLYRSSWSEGRAKGIEGVVQAQEEAGETYLRAHNGQLLSVLDANKVVFGIAVASEMQFALVEAMRSPGQRQKAKEGRVPKTYRWKRKAGSSVSADPVVHLSVASPVSAAVEAPVGLLEAAAENLTTLTDASRAAASTLHTHTTPVPLPTLPFVENAVTWETTSE